MICLLSVLVYSFSFKDYLRALLTLIFKFSISFCYKVGTDVV